MMQELTFEQAIAQTQSLLEKLKTNQLSPESTEREISALVASLDGARGFFVTYLTDDSNLADQPSEAVIKALASSPKTVDDLLVKNLAMSTGMAVTHLRQNNPEMAKSSQRVSRRTSDLITAINSESLKIKLKQLEASIQDSQGEYHSFLRKWQYDAEQLAKIAEAIARLEA